MAYKLGHSQRSWRGFGWARLPRAVRTPRPDRPRGRVGRVPGARYRPRPTCRHQDARPDAGRRHPRPGNASAARRSSPTGCAIRACPGCTTTATRRWPTAPSSPYVVMELLDGTVLDRSPGRRTVALAGRGPGRRGHRRRARRGPQAGRGAPRPDRGQHHDHRGRRESSTSGSRSRSRPRTRARALRAHAAGAAHQRLRRPGRAGRRRVRPRRAALPDGDGAFAVPGGPERARRRAAATTLGRAHPGVHRARPAPRGGRDLPSVHGQAPGRPARRGRAWRWTCGQR